MNGVLTETIASMPASDRAAAAETARLLDAKTKPPGSLGRLESLAVELASIRGAVPRDRPEPAIVVAAADHGVWEEGVSPYPQSVTGQMVANFVNGGAAVCVLARRSGARLVVVDTGVIDPIPTGSMRSAVVDDVRGTKNIRIGPAMPRSGAVVLVERGVALAGELADEGFGLVAIGDMGIANTTAASALAAVLLPASPASVCGPGTGLDDAGVSRKVEVVRDALVANDLGRGHVGADALDVLAAVGGLEIAFLVGVILGAAARRMPILLDGFVTGAAALVAARLAPSTVDSMIAATRSPEPGHDLILRELELQPLLDLGLRLGEGSGAVLAIPLVDAAVGIVAEMATFEAAGVSRA